MWDSTDLMVVLQIRRVFCGLLLKLPGFIYRYDWFYWLIQSRLYRSAQPMLSLFLIYFPCCLGLRFPFLAEHRAEVRTVWFFFSPLRSISFSFSSFSSLMLFSSLMILRFYAILLFVIRLWIIIGFLACNKIRSEYDTPCSCYLYPSIQIVVMTGTKQYQIFASDLEESFAVNPATVHIPGFFKDSKCFFLQSCHDEFGYTVFWHHCGTW